MTKCKYWDCGFCYAPDDIKTNATQSGCFEPEHCPYLKSQMTEIEKTEGEIKVLQAKLELLEEMEKHKSSAEKAYKEWWGEYPSTEKSVSETEDMRWLGFQAGYETAKQDYKRAEEPKPETLYEALDEVYYGTTYVRREEICDVVERWLPDEIVEDEDYEMGWNDALRSIKEKLR